MSKNFFDLLTVIVTAIECVADSFCVYFASIGKLDPKTATRIGGSITIVGNAVLGVCAHFIKEEEKKVEAK